MSVLTPRTLSCPTARSFRQPPSFLIPAFANPVVSSYSRSPFSTSHAYAKGDGNKNRGVSALRRKNPKQKLSIWNEPLPKPVLDPSRRTKPTADPDHGLWGFFPASRKALLTPEEMAGHGRAWTVQELRQKSWEDLHALWWVCVKEKNMISTQETERQRRRAGYGHHEAQARRDEVNATQRAIKHVLTERWYAFQNAHKEVRNDTSLLADADNVWEDIREEDIAGGATSSITADRGPATIPAEEQAKETRG